MIQQKNYSQRQILLIKTFIPIQTKIKEKYKSIAYLQNQKAAILYSTCILIVDLNSKRKDKEQLIETYNTIQLLSPVGQGFCYTVYDEEQSTLTLVRKDRTIQTIQYGDPFFSDVTSIYFYSSGTRLILSHEDNKQIKICSDTITVKNKLHYTYPFKGDDNNLVFNFSPHGFIVDNIHTQQKYQHSLIDIQFPNKGYEMFHNFYFINLQKVIFSMAVKQQNKIMICSTQLIPNNKVQTILQFQKYQYNQFLIMNKTKSILMFTLQGKQDTLPKTILYNYQSKQIILQTNIKFDVKSVSPQFDHFLDYDQENGIVDYLPVTIKKLYMHLITKSELSFKYGIDLTRYILKVII